MTSKAKVVSSRPGLEVGRDSSIVTRERIVSLILTAPQKSQLRLTRPMTRSPMIPVCVSIPIAVAMASGPCAILAPCGDAFAATSSTWIGVKSPTRPAQRLMSPSPMGRPGVVTTRWAFASLAGRTASSGSTPSLGMARELNARQGFAMDFIRTVADSQKARLRIGLGEKEILREARAAMGLDCAIDDRARHARNNDFGHRNFGS